MAEPQGSAGAWRKKQKGKNTISNRERAAQSLRTNGIMEMGMPSVRGLIARGAAGYQRGIERLAGVNPGANAAAYAGKTARANTRAAATRAQLNALRANEARAGRGGGRTGGRRTTDTLDSMRSVAPPNRLNVQPPGKPKKKIASLAKPKATPVRGAISSSTYKPPAATKKAPVRYGTAASRVRSGASSNTYKPPTPKPNKASIARKRVI